jgi:peroxiredoxin
MLKALSEEMAARGVAFVGVDVRDQKASATSFQARHGIRYPSLFDRSGATVLSFKRLPATPPSTVILDKQGRVAARVLGETSASTLRPLIDDVLAEAGP